MGGGEDHGRGAAGVVGLEPARGAHAPAVAGLEARKSRLRARRRQIVSGLATEREELRVDDRADRVAAQVLGPRRAAAVAEEAGQRPARAFEQRAADDVPVRISGDAAIVTQSSPNRLRSLRVNVWLTTRSSGRREGQAKHRQASLPRAGDSLGPRSGPSVVRRLRRRRRGRPTRPPRRRRASRWTSTCSSTTSSTAADRATDEVIRKLDADVVGVLESYERLPEIARRTGYPYYNTSLQLLSKYPILEPSGGDGLYALIEVAARLRDPVLQRPPRLRRLGPARARQGRLGRRR